MLASDSERARKLYGVHDSCSPYHRFYDANEAFHEMTAKAKKSLSMWSSAQEPRTVGNIKGLIVRLRASVDELLRHVRDDTCEATSAGATAEAAQPVRASPTTGGRGGGGGACAGACGGSCSCTDCAPLRL